MRRKFLSLLAAVIFLTVCYSVTAFAAISESEVQSQVEALGKETVSGNVLIWFLCAIAFLKVSQKVDSFLSSLGINVGHTGGSMLAEAMIAARGLGAVRNFSSQHFGGNRSSANGPSSSAAKTSGAGGFMAGGLAGVVSRSITNSAVKAASSAPDSAGKVPKASGLGSLVSGAVAGQMYASSMENGGNFANDMIGTVATGNPASLGFMSG